MIIGIADADDDQIYRKKRCDISCTEQVDVHSCFSGREQPQEEQEEQEEYCQKNDRGEDLFHNALIRLTLPNVPRKLFKIKTLAQI